MSIRLRYAAVLFDLDGTLIDSSQDLIAAVHYALQQVDERELPDDDTIIMEIGKPLETILRELGYPCDQTSTACFVDAYRSHFAEHFNDHTRLFPDVKDVLEMLRSSGARLALVTAKHQSQAEFTARGTGLAGYFHHICGWQEGRRHKPDPEPVRLALDLLGVGPEQGLMVGDTEQDILAAKAAGVDTCAVTYGFRPVLLLRTLRPDFMVSRAADLVPIVIDLARVDEGPA